jgi:hypothetical protein
MSQIDELVHELRATSLEDTALNSTQISTLPRGSMPNSVIAQRMILATKIHVSEKAIRNMLASNNARLTVNDLVAIRVNPYISKYYTHAVAISAWQISNNQEANLNTRTVGEEVMEDVMNAYVHAFQPN